MAVLSVYRGHWRWYVHDLEMERLAAADPPSKIPDGVMRNLQDSVNRSAAGPLSVTEPLIIGVVGVVVRPKPGAEWIRELDVLPSKPLFVRPRYADRLE